MDTTEKPEPLDVKCSKCEAKIGQYIGPIGYSTPIQSRYFTRLDGTRPSHGSSTAGICAACKGNINELDCCIEAIASALAVQTAAEVLAEAPIQGAAIEVIATPATEGNDDELSSDCSP